MNTESTIQAVAIHELAHEAIETTPLLQSIGRVLIEIAEAPHTAAHRIRPEGVWLEADRPDWEGGFPEGAARWEHIEALLPNAEARIRAVTGVGRA